MNRRLLTILLISFAIAGTCAFLVYKIVGARVTAQAKPVVTTRVVAAASDIKLGSVLSGERSDHHRDSGDGAEGRDSEV